MPAKFSSPEENRKTKQLVDFYIEGDHVVTNKAVHKKMSGSRLAPILGINSYGRTDFQIACDLLGVCRKEFETNATKAGNYLEEPIIELANQVFADFGMFITARELFPDNVGKSYSERKPDWNDEYFSGNIDCMLYGADGEQYIVDVKTANSRKKKEWVEGVPEDYQIQIGLYNHFLAHQDKAYFLVCFLSDEEQAHPENVVLAPMVTDENGNTTGNVYLCEYKIDQELFRLRINKAIAWYDKYIKNGITPPFNDYEDAEMVSHLRTITSSLDDITGMIDTLERVKAEIEVKEAEFEYLKDVEKDLTAKVKTFMTTHKRYDLPSSSGKIHAVVTTEEKRSLNPIALRNDGIDPEKYMTSKIIQKITFKPIKETPTEPTTKESE